jgi:four helix bundle protein
MYVFYFEKLIVWQEAIQLTKELYHLTKKFPHSERYCLIDQLHRASISIASNLAEVSSRKTSKDQAYFSTIGYGRLLETLNLIILSYELKYLNEAEYHNLRSSIEKLANKINALRKRQLLDK